MAEETWSHIFDFNQNAQGFVDTSSRPNNAGTWVDGTGFIPTPDGADVNGWWRRETIRKKVFSQTTFIKMVMTYDYTLGNYNINEPGIELFIGSSNPFILRNDMVNGVDLILSWTGLETVTEFSFNLVTDRANPGPRPTFVGSGAVKRIVVTGVGDNPFVPAVGCAACELGVYAGLDVEAV